MMLSLTGFTITGMVGAVIHVLFIAFLALFLSIMIYWFNRTGKVPSLKIIFKIIVLSTLAFPRIFFHRIKTAPRRLLHRVHPKKFSPATAYPALAFDASKSGMKKNKSRTRVGSARKR
ncbi:MAG: hypothetical protein AABY11_02130 [archaeon]